MCFSAAASSENDHGSMNLASNTAPVSLTSPSSVAAIQGMVGWTAWRWRALLDITQPELAQAAGLGLSTIVDFEKSRRDASRDAVHALQKALEESGIRFIAKNGGGPGVRLRPVEPAPR